MEVIPNGRLVFVCRTFLNENDLYVRIWTIKIARAIFARLLFREHMKCKKNARRVRETAIYDRNAREAFFSPISCGSLYTSRGVDARVLPLAFISDIDLTLFSISLFFCHAEHRKASPNSLRFYGFWQVTSDRFYFNLKCRRISPPHTRSQIFLPRL